VVIPGKSLFRNAPWWALILLALMVGSAVLGPFFSPYGYEETGPLQFDPPSWAHWLGTDLHGRDVLTRILYGARVSLMVGCVGAAVSLVVGVSYGLVSGYLGGRTDNAMMRFVDILYALPRIILIIVLITIFDQRVKAWLDHQNWTWLYFIPSLFSGGAHEAMEKHDWNALVSNSRLILLFVGLGLVEWLTMARIVRGQTLSLKERAFVQASKTLGQPGWKIMLLHILPNLQGIVIVYLTLTIPSVILEESFLSFLGLGVQAPQSSWGTLLSDGASLINPLKIYWWLLAGPAFFMAMTLLSLNFIGDWLRDRLDPRYARLR
jgi:oligopeptide transport system permease protein